MPNRKLRIDFTQELHIRPILIHLPDAHGAHRWLGPVFTDSSVIPMSVIWNQTLGCLVGKDGAHGLASCSRIVKAGEKAAKKTVPAKIGTGIRRPDAECAGNTDGNDLVVCGVHP